MYLEVRQQRTGDVYRDIVRIPERHRRDSQGRLVREGTIVKLVVSDGASRIVWLRGMEDTIEPWIRMDDQTRNDLGVVTKQEYDFRIERANVCRKLGWVLNSSDPALRIAGWLGATSVVLGVFGLIISIVSALWR